MYTTRNLFSFGLCLSLMALMLYVDTPSKKIQLQPKETGTPTSKTVAEDFRGFEMIYIPAGVFNMGVTFENLIELCFKNLKVNDRAYCTKVANQIGEETGIFQVRNVEIAGFWADQYEVTIEQYQSCISTLFISCREIDMPSFPLLTNDPKKPRVGVNWYDAVLFCNTRGARLPSEVEWEYMAKGKQNLAFPWGDSLLPEYEQNTNSPHAVGAVSKNVSWYGIYDLSGNIMQWVEDRFQPYIASQVETNESLMDDTLRVVRGASWNEKGFRFLNVYRFGLNPASQNTDVGFRCVRTSDPRK